jgi:hypothetical protein
MEPNMPFPTSSPSGSSPSAPDDAAFRTLALRLLALHVPFSAPVEADVALLVGQLPTAFPGDIPFPDGSRLAGSLVRGEHVTVVLDADQPPDAIQEFYQQRMPAIGWAMPDFMGPRHGGFMPSGPFGGPPLLFCRGEQGPGLHIHTQAREGAPTDLRLELVTYDNPGQSPCARQRFERPGRPHAMEMIPALFAPPRSQQQGGGGSSGQDHANTTAQLESDLDLATLNAHYTRQFEQGGWSNSGEGVSGPTAWSRWTFADDEGGPWTGIFFALELPGRPGHFFLTTQIAWAGPGMPGGRRGGASQTLLGSTWSSTSAPLRPPSTS